MVTTVNSVVNTPAAVASASKSAVANKALSANYDTFLKLLTTQLQNQDPTKPMDSTEFTSQLVQYSTVEQEIQQNSNLENLISLFKGQQTTGAVGYIGKQITANGGQATLSNGQANWAYKMDGAGQAVFTIKDANGKIVASSQQSVAAGAGTYAWNGKGSNQSQLPDGVYTLDITALDANGSTVGSTVYTSGVVTSVDTVNGNQMLSLNGAQVALSDVLSVAQPQ